MPTILRFRNFRIEIFTEDHTPSHVHARGPGIQAIFFLRCWTGPVELRESYGLNTSIEKALSNFLTDNLELLCKAWENLHGDSTRT
jgi:hypothetical protein